jgi:hypothetical protein
MHMIRIINSSTADNPADRPVDVRVTRKLVRPDEAAASRWWLRTEPEGGPAELLLLPEGDAQLLHRLLSTSLGETLAKHALRLSLDDEQMSHVWVEVEVRT